MTRGGLVSSTFSSCAARRDSASTEISMPGRERPADELAPRADRVEVGRGAEVDHDGRPAVQVDGGERVHDPVAADLLGVVHPIGTPVFTPGATMTAGSRG
jgi:hypothetical protein